MIIKRSIRNMKWIDKFQDLSCSKVYIMRLKDAKDGKDDRICVRDRDHLSYFAPDGGFYTDISPFNYKFIEVKIDKIEYSPVEVL